MLTNNIESLEESVLYVLSIDRRVLVAKEFQNRPVLRSSDIAKRVNRSLQNISRALNELEDEKIVMCINAQSHTWKKYILTEKGIQVFDILKTRKLI
jgi:DNA-binding HxlR family transcriptional regulator